MTDESGDLVFKHANICQTLANVDFLCELVKNHVEFMRAHAKKYKSHLFSYHVG